MNARREWGARRDKADRNGIVAGRRPLGRHASSRGTMTHAQRLNLSEQPGLKEGGVDVLWIETISAPEEKGGGGSGALAGCRGAAREFRHRREQMMGDPRDGRDGEKLPHRDRIWRNCGVGASDDADGVACSTGTERPLIAKGKRHPKYHDGHTYDGTTEVGEYAGLARMRACG